MKIFLSLMILFTGFLGVSAQSEQAPLLEKELKYKDWTYKSVADDKEVNLRQFAQGKKLVMVVYFAPWCPNWKHEAPFVQKLYEKYKPHGFDVIGVSEYDTAANTKSHSAFYKLTFPVVYESVSLKDRQKTSHYELRKEAGDTRNWGSPWSVFLEPAKLNAKGDVLTKKTFVVNGELIEAETEKFVRQKLGLSEEKLSAELGKKDKAIEACAEDSSKKVVSFKKP